MAFRAARLLLIERNSSSNGNGISNWIAGGTHLHAAELSTVAQRIVFGILVSLFENDPRSESENGCSV